MSGRQYLLKMFRRLRQDSGMGRVVSRLEPTAVRFVKKPEHIAMIADHQLSQNDTTGAIRTLKTGMSRFSDSDLLTYKLAFALERSKDYDDAHRHYADLADKEDGDQRSFYRLAKVNEARGLHDDALAWAVVYTGLVPDDPRGHQLAYKLAKGQPVWRRLEILQAGLEHFAVTSQWIEDCITLNHQMRRYDKCISIYEDFADRVSGKAFARVVAAMVKTRGVKNARMLARKYAIARHVNDVDVFPGDQLKSLGDWGSAAELYILEFEITGSLNAARGAGLSLAREFQWAESSTWYYSSLRGGPEDERTHYDLGVSLEKQGLYIEASQHYLDAAKRLTASNYRVYRAIYCLERAGETPRAAELLSRVLESHEEPEREPSTSPMDHTRIESLLNDARSKQSEGVLRYVTQLAMRTELWGIALQAGLELIARCGKHLAKDYYLVARAQLELNNSYEAVQAYLASRIYRHATLISSETYEKSKFNRICMRYSAFREDLPVDGEAILYESNHGAKVTCNILPLLDHTSSAKEYSNWKHYIVVPSRGHLPAELRERNNIIVVEKQSDLYLRILATAKYLVSNNTFPAYFSRRADQLYLNTWHGTPIKSMGKDIKNGNYDHKNASRNLLHCTHLALPNAHTSIQMLERYDVAHIFPGQLKLTGSPRIDRSFNLSAPRRREIRAELGASDETRVVLFAPTWRGELGDVHSSDAYLDDVAEAASRNGWLPVYRGHPVTNAGSRAEGANFVVVPDDIDTNDLLGAVDAVVSDYSSISIDAACVGLPVLLYIPDFAEYDADRGLSVDLARLGLSSALDLSSLFAWFSTSLSRGFGESDPLELAKYEDGNATQRVVDFFFKSEDVIAQPRPEDETNVLLFEGHFIPNGISSAAREANKAMIAAGINVTLAIEPTAITGDDLRSHELEVASANCAVLPRVIGNLDNAEERWVVQRQHYGFELTTGHERLIERSYEREFVRLYGAAQFDTVVGFEGFSLYWSNLMASSRDGKKLGFIHADMEKEAINRFSHLWNLFPIYSRYDSLASVSRDAMKVNRETLSDWIAPDKFVLVENLIDPQRIAHLAEGPLSSDLSAFLEAHRFNFTSVGRLSIEKGGDRLVDAFLRVCDTRSDVGLVVVGDGIMRAELERRVYSRGHEDHVYFVGFDENPYKVMAGCDCLVLASRHEGQGIVVLEALSLRKRVIATDIPGPRSILAGARSMLVEDSVDGIHGGMLAELSDDSFFDLPSVDEYVERARRQLLTAIGVERCSTRVDREAVV